jgi:hypothetical protein
MGDWKLVPSHSFFKHTYSWWSWISKLGTEDINYNNGWLRPQEVWTKKPRITVGLEGAQRLWLLGKSQWTVGLSLPQLIIHEFAEINAWSTVILWGTESHDHIMVEETHQGIAHLPKLSRSGQKYFPGHPKRFCFVTVIHMKCEMTERPPGVE